MEYRRTSDLLDKVLVNIKKRMSKNVRGVSTGFYNLDMALGGFGFEAGCIYTFASRPSMGKTAFLLNILVHQLSQIQKDEVLIYLSTKDKSHVLMQKILAIISSVELRKIQFGHLSNEEFQEIEKASVILEAAADQLIIVEKETPYIDELKVLIQKQNTSGKKVKMLIIDQIQDVEVGLQFNKEEVLKGAMVQLKTISKENNLPIILSSSVSRKVESRTENKVPKLEDLLHSKHIGLLSDYVIMLLRPEYYEVQDEFFEPDESFAHLVIQKSKCGPLETLFLETNISKQQFFNIKLITDRDEIV